MVRLEWKKGSDECTNDSIEMKRQDRGDDRDGERRGEGDEEEGSQWKPKG